MAWRSSFKRVLAGASLVVLGTLASACATNNRAWLVKPHQREFLADRIMRPDSNALESSADQHVFTTREGAIGGGGTVGGGCGCN